MGNIICQYCATQNKDGEKRCLACGAPLPDPEPAPQPQKLALGSRRLIQIEPSAQKRTLEEVRKAGVKVDRTASRGLYIYALFWRTLAETFAIALVGFALGVIGGATGMAVWGVLFAAGLGLAVGFTMKMSYFTILSAPIGVAAGAVLCVLLWFLGAPVQVMVFVIAVCTILAALLRIPIPGVTGRRIPYTRRDWWQKLRPFLGLLGGLAFGLLGMAVGLGLRAAGNTLGL